MTALMKYFVYFIFKYGTYWNKFTLSLTICT